MTLKLNILDGQFAIHRLAPDQDIPQQVCRGRFWSVSKTEDELSIVCDAAVALDSPRSETGWSCIKVAGPLDFALTGILAGLSAVLAASQISIFAVSTFDTDYILVKTDQLGYAKRALVAAGHRFEP